jgi:hypothetical protein
MPEETSMIPIGWLVLAVSWSSEIARVQPLSIQSYVGTIEVAGEVAGEAAGWIEFRLVDVTRPLRVPVEAGRWRLEHPALFEVERVGRIELGGRPAQAIEPRLPASPGEGGYVVHARRTPLLHVFGADTALELEDVALIRSATAPSVSAEQISARTPSPLALDLLIDAADASLPWWLSAPGYVWTRLDLGGACELELAVALQPDRRAHGDLRVQVSGASASTVHELVLTSRDSFRVAVPLPADGQLAAFGRIPAGVYALEAWGSRRGGLARLASMSVAVYGDRAELVALTVPATDRLAPRLDR